MVLGGASFSELAAMYSLMAKHKQEIVVCTTDYLTPGRYMQKLCSMGKDASDRPSQLNSPSDASQ